MKAKRIFHPIVAARPMINKSLGDFEIILAHFFGAPVNLGFCSLLWCPGVSESGWAPESKKETNSW